MLLLLPHAASFRSIHPSGCHQTFKSSLVIARFTFLMLQIFFFILKLFESSPLSVSYHLADFYPHWKITSTLEWVHSVYWFLIHFRFRHECNSFFFHSNNLSNSSFTFKFFIFVPIEAFLLSNEAVQPTKAPGPNRPQATVDLDNYSSWSGKFFWPYLVWDFYY